MQKRRTKPVAKRPRQPILLMRKTRHINCLRICGGRRTGKIFGFCFIELQGLYIAPTIRNEDNSRLQRNISTLHRPTRGWKNEIHWTPWLKWTSWITYGCGHFDVQLQKEPKYSAWRCILATKHYVRLRRILTSCMPASCGCDILTCARWTNEF